MPGEGEAKGIGTPGGKCLTLCHAASKPPTMLIAPHGGGDGGRSIGRPAAYDRPEGRQADRAKPGAARGGKGTPGGLPIEGHGCRSNPTSTKPGSRAPERAGTERFFGCAARDHRDGRSQKERVGRGGRAPPWGTD